MVGMVEEVGTLSSKETLMKIRFYSFDIGVFFKQKVAEMGGVLRSMELMVLT